MAWRKLSGHFAFGMSRNRDEANFTDSCKVKKGCPEAYLRQPFWFYLPALYG